MSAIISVYRVGYDVGQPEWFGTEDQFDTTQLSDEELAELLATGRVVVGGGAVPPVVIVRETGWGHDE